MIERKTIKKDVEKKDEWLNGICHLFWLNAFWKNNNQMVERRLNDIQRP